MLAVNLVKVVAVLNLALIGFAGSAFADAPTPDTSPMGFGTIHDQVPIASREFEFDLNRHLTPLLASSDAGLRGISLSSTAQLYETEANKYRMTRGCVLINAGADMQVETPVTTVYAKAGTSFVVHNDANVTRVMNLHDRARHSVQVVIEKKYINLNPGEELGVVRTDLPNGQVAASGPNVGYRSMRGIPVADGYRVYVFEFSIADALKHCVIFEQLRESNAEADKFLLTEIVKTAGRSKAKAM